MDKDFRHGVKLIEASWQIYPYLSELKTSGVLNTPQDADELIQNIYNDNNHPYHSLVLDPETGPFIRAMANQLGHWSDHDWDAMQKKFQGFSHSEKLTERFAMGKPDLSEIIEEMFPDKNEDWHNAATFTTKETLSTIADLSQLPEQIPHAYLHGSVARRMFGTHSDFSIVADILANSVHRLPQESDPYYYEVLRPFLVGPNDIDLRYVSTDLCNSDKLFSALTERFSIYKNISITRFPIMEGMNVLEVQMNLEGKPLSIHIVQHPEEDQNSLENRFALHLSQKRLLCIPITRVGENPCIFSPEIIAETIDLDVIMGMPSAILNPEYPTVDQCLYAGLSLIRHELFWPSYIATRIVPKTIETYRNELQRLVASAVKGKHEVASEYRIGELMREFILCLTIDPKATITMMDQLGILDNLGLRYNSTLQIVAEQLSSQEALHDKLRSNPYFLFELARILDIQSLVTVPSPPPKHTPT